MLWAEYAITGMRISYQCAFSYTTKQECQDNNKILSLVFVQKCTDPLSGMRGHGCSRLAESPIKPHTPSFFLCPLILRCQTICSTWLITALCHTNRDAVWGFGKDTSAQCKAPEAFFEFFYFFCLGAVDRQHVRLTYLIAKKQQMGWRWDLTNPGHPCLWWASGNFGPCHLYAGCWLGWGEKKKKSDGEELKSEIEVFNDPSIIHLSWAPLQHSDPSFLWHMCL